MSGTSRVGEGGADRCLRGNRGRRGGWSQNQPDPKIAAPARPLFSTVAQSRGRPGATPGATCVLVRVRASR